MQFLTYFLLLLFLPAYLCAENVSLEHCLSNYKKAFMDLDACRHEINVRTSSVRNYDTITTYFDYDCTSHFAQEAIHKHRRAFEKLEKTLFVDTYVEGVVLGFFCGILTSFLNRDVADKKTIGAMVIAALARIGFQNHSLGKVPYYDSLYLKKYSNFFSGLSFRTIARLSVLLVGQAVGHVATNYCMYRLFK